MMNNNGTDFSKVIGMEVNITVDRPMGSVHPECSDLIYPVNYGYVEDIMAADNEEQDVYLLGVNVPVQSFTGRIIAVYHRYNDVEDKWIAAPEGVDFSDEEILRQIHFVEQFFDGKLYR